METLHSFINTNMVLMYFIYGQVYFTTGLAIALQQRALSKFRLASRLWMLAGFGIIHGLAEWGNVFIPIQTAYLNPSWMSVLSNMQDVAFAVSFAFLLQFGLTVLVPWLGWDERRSRLLLWAAPAWSAAITVISLLMPGGLGESTARYLLGFPAALITAAAFLAERQSFVRFPSKAARSNLTVTAVLFALYAFFSGLVVSTHGMWPLQWLTYDNVFSRTGFPIQFYRALLGLAIAFFIIRTLSIFDLEVRHRFDASEKEKALLKDRQRIARDLHDGAVQAIYAAGLQLEVARSSLAASSPEEAFIITRVMDQLGSVMSDIRRYIFKLGPSRIDESDVGYHLRKLVDDFCDSCHIETSLSMNGGRVPLTNVQKQNLILIARECLSNVAKHSLASRVDVDFSYQDDGVQLNVIDNGIGMRGNRISERDQHGKGLKNITERVKAMNGSISIIAGRNGNGTKICIRAPYEPDDAAATLRELVTET